MDKVVGFPMFASNLTPTRISYSQPPTLVRKLHAQITVRLPCTTLRTHRMLHRALWLRANSSSDSRAFRNYHDPVYARSLDDMLLLDSCTLPPAQLVHYPDFYHRYQFVPFHFVNGIPGENGRPHQDRIATEHRHEHTKNSSKRSSYLPNVSVQI